MFTSAVSIFSAGTSFAWVKDTICAELIDQAEATRQDVYSLMNEVAAKAPVGSNKLLFNPMFWDYMNRLCRTRISLQVRILLMASANPILSVPPDLTAFSR